MKTEEIAQRLARGGHRYHGEWHLKTCEENNAGVACDDDCAAERDALRKAGVTVTCPDTMSWGAWGRQIEAMTNPNWHPHIWLGEVTNG